MSKVKGVQMRIKETGGRLMIVLLAMVLPLAFVGGASAATSATWCPSYHEYNGCDTTQSPSQYSVSFAPSQVTVGGSNPSAPFTWNGSSTVDLNMNSSGTDSGAINTDSYEAYTVPFTISETINLACYETDHVYNWPAFWTVGDSGTWPANEEFDVFDAGGTGSGAGVMTADLHYVDPLTGDSETISTTPSGFNPCGSVTYSLHVTSTQATWIWGGKTVMTVTFSSSIPAPTVPQYVIDDYGYSTTYAGPLGKSKTMAISNYTYSDN